jgi:hypothetical protein
VVNLAFDDMQRALDNQQHLSPMSSDGSPIQDPPAAIIIHHGISPQQALFPPNPLTTVATGPMQDPPAAITTTGNIIFFIRSMQPAGTGSLGPTDIGIAEYEWSWQLGEDQEYQPSLADSSGAVPLIEALWGSLYHDQLQTAYKNPGKAVQMRAGARTRSGGSRDGTYMLDVNLRNRGGSSMIAYRLPLSLFADTAAYIPEDMLALDENGHAITPRYQASGKNCCAYGVLNCIALAVDQTAITVKPTRVAKVTEGMVSGSELEACRENQHAIIYGTFDSHHDYFVAHLVNGMGAIQAMARGSRASGCKVRINKVDMCARGLTHHHMLRWLIGAHGAFVCQFARHVISIIDGILYETDPSYPKAINLRARPIEDTMHILRTMGITGINVARKVVLHEEPKAGKSKRPLSNPEVLPLKRFAPEPWDESWVMAGVRGRGHGRGRGHKQAAGSINTPADENVDALVAHEEVEVAVETVVSTQVGKVKESMVSGSELETIYTMIGAKLGSEKLEKLKSRPLDLFQLACDKIAGGMCSVDADKRTRATAIKYFVAMRLMLLELPALMESGELDGFAVHRSSVRVSDTMVRVVAYVDMAYIDLDT